MDNLWLILQTSMDAAESPERNMGMQLVDRAYKSAQCGIVYYVTLLPDVMRFPEPDHSKYKDMENNAKQGQSRHELPRPVCSPRIVSCFSLP